MLNCKNLNNSYSNFNAQLAPIELCVIDSFYHYANQKLIKYIDIRHKFHPEHQNHKRKRLIEKFLNFNCENFGVNRAGMDVTFEFEGYENKIRNYNEHLSANFTANTIYRKSEEDKNTIFMLLEHYLHSVTYKSSNNLTNFYLRAVLFLHDSKTIIQKHYEQYLWFTSSNSTSYKIILRDSIQILTNYNSSTNEFILNYRIIN
jgi:hypothetical protein